MIKRIPLLLILFFSAVHAQEWEYTGSVNLHGLISTDSLTPFWFHSNKRGRIDEKTNFSGYINAAARYTFNSETFVEVGGGGLFQSGFTDKLQPDEYYLTFHNDWFEGVLGRKQRAQRYKGLSATTENMLWSLNARPMPGVRFNTTRPVMFWRGGWLGFEAGLEEYLMDDERHITNTRVHHKNFKLVFSRNNWEVGVGIQHFVQWAGTSSKFGKLPGSLNDYLRIFSGMGIGGTANDQVSEEEINGLGNHLGSYEASVKTSFRNYSIEFVWNHIFEDGSGSRFVNFPDGRYGIFISDLQDEKWIYGIMYEFYYTKNQSKNSLSTDGTDNYFNNNLYRSGWTYGNRVLGVPFIKLKESRIGIGNNIFVAHHLGISGMAFETMPYKIMTSYSMNYGGKGSQFLESENILSTYLDVKVLRAYMDLNVQIGGDFSTASSPNLGIGLHFSRSLF